ncbi:uncharacterized protein LOC119741852 isoform X2 [Patiria miniata]|uniref:Shisa N-terminal domain-containing protein n=1 Tax=Patiria miniata TaxID=46514 RepID=A0A914BBT3_PATMI|nr:uncharacterized protein LOC119741852 isoform X2 [Patiria miniata]
MVPFLMQLVVFVALCSFSKASRHTCSDYQDKYGNYQSGLSCSVSGLPDRTYCCESSYLQYCCTETEWQDQSPAIPDETNYSSNYTHYWAIGGGMVIFIALIILAAIRVTLTRRRAAVVVTSRRVTAPTSVVTVSTGNPATRVGPYQQFENPPSYTPN